MNISRTTNFKTPLLIFERFEPLNAIHEKQQIDHIAGRNNPYLNVSKPQNTIPEYQHINSFKSALHISDCFTAQNAIHEHQQIKLIAGGHCTYLNVSHPETTIPEHQEIDPLAEWY